MIGIWFSNASRSHRLSAASGFLAHEGVVDRLVALENLAMHLALVVVPDLAARLREDGLDRQQEPHLLRLEDAALRIDERNALALETGSPASIRSRSGDRGLRPAFAHDRKPPRASRRPDRHRSSAPPAIPRSNARVGRQGALIRKSRRLRSNRAALRPATWRWSTRGLSIRGTRAHCASAGSQCRADVGCHRVSRREVAHDERSTRGHSRIPHESCYSPRRGDSG